jgi:hypothetical protein
MVVKGTIDKSQLKRIDSNEIRMLWAVDWWDGPQSGIAEYMGQRVYFNSFDEKFIQDPADPDDCKYLRIMAVFKLTPEQIASEEYWHNQFLENVGNSSHDFREETKDMKLKPEKEWQKFYQQYKERKKFILTQNDAIGWFEY